MRKILFLAAAALPLAACATSPYGYNNNPYGSSGVLGALGGILGASSGYGYGNSAYGYGGAGFQQAAVNSCAQTAARYGQVSVTQVRQVSSSTLRVYGQVRMGYGARNWDCDFRSDGRITDFDI